MTISEETLMAFADGELDAAAQAAVEAAMREDPELEKQVARHRALRIRVQQAFAEELSAPVPQRLLAVLRKPSGRVSNVVDLKNARAVSARTAQARDSGDGIGTQRPSSGDLWRHWGSIAAGVVLGLGIGYGMWRQGAVPIVHGASGTLVANGQLAAALSNRASADQADASAPHIGISYLAKSGQYCRSFMLAAGIAGLACKDQQQWQIQALTQGKPAGGSEYRTAATAVSPVILKLIEEQIQGEPLDAAAESAARQRGWQAPK